MDPHPKTHLPLTHELQAKAITALQAHVECLARALAIQCMQNQGHICSKQDNTKLYEADICIQCCKDRYMPKDS